MIDSQSTGIPPPLNKASRATRGIPKANQRILKSHGLLTRDLLEALMISGVIPEAVHAIQAKSISIF